MKILTIDFDIIMNPCIDIYNDSDLTADEYLNKFDFLGMLSADLFLYKKLTNFINSLEPSKIHFIYDHHDIIPLLEDKNNIELINIDYHHDIGYDDEKFWNIPLEQNYDEGNWVKKLWDDNKLKSYLWLCDYKSYPPVEEGEKYLTEWHYINSYDLNFLLDADEVYISLSSPWIPSYYVYLYDLWEDLINNK